MNYQPTRNIILIKADPARTQTTSGLYIQEDWKTVPPSGTVVAIGPEVTTVVPGDRVLFARYAALIMEDDLRLVVEGHIHAKILGDEKGLDTVSGSGRSQDAA
jgi:co-chaperonin GroES (HSP10)